MNDVVVRGRVVQGEVNDENAWVMGGVGGHAGLFGDSLSGALCRMPLARRCAAVPPRIP